MRYLLILLGFVVIQSSHAQYLGPIGPGEGSIAATTLKGEFAQWNRQATPSLVLRTAGPGLKVFADIDASGSFTLTLPEFTAETIFGQKGCGDPSKGPVSILNSIDLLTPLEGFGSPSEANQGLSVIGMALFADEAYIKDIGIKGGKRLEFFSSPQARTLEVGECNNLNPIELKAGWTAVTQISSGNGGPHSYDQGVDSTMSWYWWAFQEAQAPNDEPNTETPALPEASIIPATTDSLIGEWNALEFEGKMDLTFDASGEVLFESSEGNGQMIKGSWAINEGTALLELEGVGGLDIELRSNNSLSVSDSSNGINLEFIRAGMSHNPSSMIGVFEASSGQGMIINLAADGQATIDFGFEERPLLEGNWHLKDYHLIIESPSTNETLQYMILSMAEIGFNLTGENLSEEVVFFFKK